MLRVYKVNFLSISSPIRTYTLFGALCWAYRLSYGEDKLISFLNNFKNEPVFLLSSLFPIIRYSEKCNSSETKEAFLFPKPILPLKNKCKTNQKSSDLKEICNKRERKKYKKAQYITEEVLKDFIEGKINEEADFIENNEYSVYEKNIIYKSNSELNFKSQIKSTLLTKNVINRITSTSANLYTEEAIFFDTQFFLAKFYDNGFIKTFEILLRIVEEFGLGKNKNIGWGKIKFENTNELQWLDNNIDNEEKFITLSPIIPTNNIDISKSFYDFEIYKAPVENTFNNFLLKQKVIYLKEGSFITSSSQNYKGQLKQVIKDKPIYQYGLEFPIKVNNNE